MVSVSSVMVRVNRREICDNGEQKVNAEDRQAVALSLV